MDDNYLSTVTHVIPLTTIRRVRTLPVPGAVTVRVNEKVNAAQVVAEAEPTPRHFFLDIARGLGVSERQVNQYMVCQRGDRVEAGDVIAGPVGIARRTVRAPDDGRVVAINRGRVLFEVHDDPFKLRSGFPGKVIATDGSRKVTIETTGALIQAVWGNGLEDYGVMRLVGDGPTSRLHTGILDINLRGAILVAGYCDQPAPLHQATELSVRGVILGGVASELIPIAQRLPYPLVITEGFGARMINSVAYGLLSSNVGREVALFAHPSHVYRMERPEVIIPAPATRAVDLPDEVIALKPGLRVRILRSPYQGEVGVVQKMLPRANLYPSGVRAPSITVEMEKGGTATVPLANVDVLQ
jgi:hypothetical protein